MPMRSKPKRRYNQCRGVCELLNVKHQDQRIREVEAEIVVLQLCCRDVMHAIKEAQGESPELRSVFARLFEKRLAAVAEWRRLNNIGSRSSPLHLLQQLLAPRRRADRHPYLGPCLGDFVMRRVIRLHRQ